jgi:DNA primase
VSGRIDDALLNEIRDRSNVVQIVGDYVTLRKAGNHYKGLCPFHNEKSPSFTVHEDRQFFYCFGCQTGGDVISFLRQLNGYSFYEALTYLADRAGIQLPAPEPRYSGTSQTQDTVRVSSSEKGACYATGKAAQDFYRDAYGALEGTRVRGYLEQRGITEEAALRYGLGFAPARWDGLLQALQHARQDIAVAQTLGLLQTRKDGSGHYDRFRDRLMCPIRNVAGEVIAFSGRDLSGEDDAAKYMNSPENPVFTKGRVLYGLFEARKALRQAGQAIFVEGNLDVVRLAQEGLEEVVAPLGTALTPAQCLLIKRFVSKVVLVFDGDKAGRAATDKGAATALISGLQVSIVLLPDGDDPDSFVSREGPEALRFLIEHALPGWDHLVDQAIKEEDAFLDPSGPIRVVDRLAPVLLDIGDRRVRLLFQQSLAKTLDLEIGTLSNFLRDAKTKTSRRPSEEIKQEVSTVSTASAPIVPRELNLLALMLTAPDSCGLYTAHDVGELITHPALRRIADALAKRWEAEQSTEAAGLIQEIDDAHLRSKLFSALSTAPEIDNWTIPFEQLELGLKVDVLSRDMKRLKRQLDDAAKRGDEQEIDRLGMRAIELDREIELLRSNRGLRWQN